MREHIGADWAFGIKGAIENVVRAAFPSEVRLWPLLQNFDFESYEISRKYLIIILKDKLSGIPTGFEPKPFPHTDHPQLPVTAENIDNWQSYLFTRFNLRAVDAAFVLPIYDSGKSSALADYKLFDQRGKDIWDIQLRLTVARQKIAIQPISKTTPHAPTHIAYNVSGTNARININSSDSSVNVVHEELPPVFEDLLNAIRDSAIDSEKIKLFENAINEMREKYGTSDFIKSYKSFISVLADHIQVLGPVIAPYLPSLAGLLC